MAISPQAREFIDRLGQSHEFEMMVDWARRVAPGLRSIEVALDEATDDMPAGVVPWTHRDHIGPDDDPTHRSWIDWLAPTFPPEVCQNFVLLTVYRANGR